MLPDFELWLDNQLPSILAKWISDDFGWMVKSSYQLKLHKVSDWEIYSRAKSNPISVILLSKDGDFPKMLAINGSPPKLIKLNTGNLPNRQLWNMLRPHLKEAVDHLLHSSATIVIIESDSN